MNIRIRNAQEHLRNAIESFEQVTKEVQEVCAHENIVQCERHTYHFGDTIPGLRLCLDCGLAEEVWYEYLATILKNPEPEFGLRTVSRDYIHKHRVGKVIEYREKE